MIEYIIPGNIDNRVTDKTCHILSNDIIIYPSDTNWVMACDPFNKKAVEKLYQLNRIGQDHHLSLHCHSISMASEFAMITDSAYRLIKPHIPGPYTFVFKASKIMRKTLKATKMDKEIGIRFPNLAYIGEILSVFEKPLLTTHLRTEDFEVSSKDELYSVLIEEKFGHQVPLILDPGEYQFHPSSSIISFVDEAPEIIREGHGDTSFFC